MRMIVVVSHDLMCLVGGL